MYNWEEYILNRKEFILSERSESKEVAMSQRGIEQLVGRALSDNGFMEAVLKDPEGETRKAGLDISPEEIIQIKQIDKIKAKRLAESFATEFGSRLQHGG